MDNNKLIEAIKNICKNNNITVTKLEEELGMSQGLISRWSKSDPSLSKIIDIADYFDISLDEVVGYRNIIHDKFLEKLIKQTVNKDIVWNKYDSEKPTSAKQYLDPDFNKIDFLDQDDINEYFEIHKQISYFVEINNSFISIYGCYDFQNIIKPSEIKLFIQPGNDAELIEQPYDYDQLKVLWLKVLYSLGEKAPDEIKAEEFKNSFINDFQKLETIKKKKKVAFVSNPQNISMPPRQRPQEKNVTRLSTTPNPINPKIIEAMAKVDKKRQEDKNLNSNNTSQTED